MYDSFSSKHQGAGEHLATARAVRDGMSDRYEPALLAELSVRPYGDCRLPSVLAKALGCSEAAILGHARTLEVRGCVVFEESPWGIVPRITHTGSLELLH